MIDNLKKSIKPIKMKSIFLFVRNEINIGML